MVNVSMTDDFSSLSMVGPFPLDCLSELESQIVWDMEQSYVVYVPTYVVVLGDLWGGAYSRRMLWGGPLRQIQPCGVACIDIIHNGGADPTNSPYLMIRDMTLLDLPGCLI